MSSMTASKAYTLMAVLFIIGIIIGYGVGMALAPSGGGGQGPTAPTGLQGTIKIGALLSLTGVLSTYGENSQAALELAEQQVNQYLHDAGANWSVQVVVEDTATDPKTALDKIQTLHGTGVLLIIGPMTSAAVSEVKNYADSNGLLVISQSSTSPALSIAGDNIFRFCPTDKIQGPAAARVAFDEGIRYLVPVWRGDTWGDGLKESQENSFKKILQTEGVDGDVLQGIRYDPNAKEFSTEAANLADVVQGLVNQYGADKVGVAFIGFEEAVSFFTAAKDHPVLMQVKWIGSDGTAGLSDLTTEATAAEFSVATDFASPIFAPGASPFRDQVKNYVKQKLGRDPDSYAYAAYDALWAYVFALQGIDKYDPNAVKAILPEIVSRMMGSSGAFQLDQNGDRASADYELWVVWPTDGGYTWKVAGMYHFATDSVEWYDWWVQAHSS